MYIGPETDETELMNLAAAIERGDRVAARDALDAVFRDDEDAIEFIQQGRYSRQAVAR